MSFFEENNENIFENTIFKTIIQNPDKVKQIPVKLYEKFMAECLINEKYEEMIVLRELKHKVVDKSAEQMIFEVEVDMFMENSGKTGN